MRMGTGRGVGGHSAADGYELASVLASAGGQRDELEHCRMQGVDSARQLGMAAIHCERVLGEIVAADREEVGGGCDVLAPSARRRGSRSLAPISTGRRAGRAGFEARLRGFGRFALPRRLVEYQGKGNT